MAARGVNKVILLGNLGQDPDARVMQTGKPVTTLSIATSETWRDKQTGEAKEQTEWHKVVLYDRLAEVAKDYLRKGSKVYVEGRLRTRKWQDKNGQDRYTTEILANELQMLDGKRDGQPAAAAPSDSSVGPRPPAMRPSDWEKTATTPRQPPPETYDDDIPF